MRCAFIIIVRATLWFESLSVIFLGGQQIKGGSHLKRPFGSKWEQGCKARCQAHWPLTFTGRQRVLATWFMSNIGWKADDGTGAWNQAASNGTHFQQTTFDNLPWSLGLGERVPYIGPKA